MSIAALTLWIIAVVLAVFGVVFTVLGLNSERGYWAQRDPSGNPDREATKLPVIIKRAWRIAAGEYRAPLRIAAIGVVLVEIALGFAVIALLLTITG